MMEKRNDFRAQMDAAMRHDNPTGDCVSEQDLIAHLRGGASSAMREKVESHLVLCAACRQRLLELQDYFQPLREEEEEPPQKDLERDWALLWRRIGLHERAARTTPLALSRQWPRSVLALAAGLIVMVGLSAGWMLRYWRDGTRVEQAIRQASDENRKVQRQGETVQKQLAELQRPQVNSPILDVYSTQSLARSAGGSHWNRIEVPPGSPVTLILNGQGQRRFPDYSIVILDGQGRQVWNAAGLTRSADGNFAMILNSGFLPDGEYRLRIFGKTSSGLEAVAEYWISLLSAAGKPRR